MWYEPWSQVRGDPSPAVWSEIWFVNLARIALAPLRMLLLIQLENLPILSNASAILFVSLSAVGAERLDEPKLLSNRAKKRFKTCRLGAILVSVVDVI